MEQMVEFILRFGGPWVYLVVFTILFGAGFGLPIPEDVTLFAAGYLSYKGASDVLMMIGVAFVGVIGGDLAIFLLGRKFGRRAAEKGPLKRILTPARLSTVEEGFKKRGNIVIFFARFMPGFRAPVFFSAGTLGVPLRVFLTFDCVAAVISVPAIVFSVFYFGSQLDYIIGIIKKVEYGIVAFVLCVILVFASKWYLNRRRLLRRAGVVQE